MDKACITNIGHKLRRILVINLKGRDQIGDLDSRIILKWMLRK
jgi:hypothetical protein